MNHYNLAHKFIFMPQAVKSSNAKAAKAAVDKEWKKLDTIQAWQLNKVKSKKEVHSGGTKRQKESPLCHLDGLMSSDKRGLEPKFQKCKGRPWSLCIFC